jgi:acetylornithine deacetylase/succinyl-diaminopimelate desuccinylase-like protein
MNKKGCISVKLSTEMDGGHSSTPEKETSITVLNKTLHNVINKQPKAKITASVYDFIRHTGTEIPFFAKTVYANKWLFKGIIYRVVPIFVNQEDLARIHGLDERKSIDDFFRSIGFYYQLIKNTKCDSNISGAIEANGKLLYF